MPMTSDIIRTAAEERLEEYVEYLCDDPWGYGKKPEVLEAITFAKKLATELGKNFDELVKERASDTELARLQEIME